MIPCFIVFCQGDNEVNSMGIRLVACLAAAGLVSACTSSSAVRTSANTAIIKTSAAPVCGGAGAARVAQKQAAIETLRAGYDRYIIVGAAGANNVSVTQGPGTYQTTGFVQRGYYQGTTTYQPGIPVVSGTHDQAFAISMFRDGEPGFQYAIPARETLGPKWQELVKSGNVGTCVD